MYSTHDYIQSFLCVRQGLRERVWETGTLQEKRAFAESCFKARIAGVTEHARAGAPQRVPDIEESGWTLGFSSEEEADLIRSELGIETESLDSDDFAF